MKILAADHVLPITSKPIERGAVVIDNAQIYKVGTRSAVEVEFPEIEIEDFGIAAIMPGLVNCHSHLELTGMRNSLDDSESDFRTWLLTLNQLRSELNDGEISLAAVAGAQEGARAGVTCFADVGRNAGAGLKALKSTGLRGIAYQETNFSPDNSTADADLLDLATKFERLKDEETDLVKVGLSPHAPYTVSSRLFELIAQYSILNRVPLTIHAAESASEMELLEHGTGFFTQVYEKFGLDWSSPHSTPIEFLDRLGVLSARPLLAHCVFVSETDIRRIASSGAAVAHCPKSNAKFGHGFAPIAAFLEADIAVGLGSDSMASNNVCDLFEESRFAALIARNHPTDRRFISANKALEMATLGGARALGMDDKIGSLEAGKHADIAVVSLAQVRQRPVNDVYAALVFATNASDVIATIVAGREVFRRTDL